MLVDFEDIYLLTLDRVDEEAGDTQVDNIIKEAINHAYMKDIIKCDKRFTTATITVQDGIATIPDDCDSIEKITPALGAGEYRKGNTIFSGLADDATYSLTYVPSKIPMVENSDVPDCNSKFFYPMSTYACYAYFEFKKRNDVAQMYLMEYKDSITEPFDDNIPEGVSDYYSVAGDDE